MFRHSVKIAAARSGHAIVAGIAMCLLISLTASWAARDASLIAGRPMAPLEVRWKPVMTVNPLPGWAPAGMETSPSHAVFPIPARWQEPGIDRYVLTVVFYDSEDAGPIVDWRSAEGIETRLSEGLGESSAPLGLHARTMVLPDAVTKDGGVVVVSMPTRQEGLVSATIQPARDVTLAVAGASLQPGLIERDGSVIESELLEGRDLEPVGGDLREGSIVEAELSAAVETLDAGLDFVVPVDERVEGAVLHTEVIGLEPDDRIDVEVNGRRIGELNATPFRLDDPAITIDADRRLTIAGWRRHSLFLPGSAWLTARENTITLRLRSSHLSPSPISLKNTYLHLRFSPPAAASEDMLAAPQRSVPAVPPETPWPVSLDEPPEPDFETPISIVDEPPPTPVVITNPPPNPYKFPPLTVQNP
jgi:hypothetical protein